MNDRCPQTALWPSLDAASSGRPDDDYYPTPRWLVEAILAETQAHVCARSVLDLGAGTGGLANAVCRAAVGHWKDAEMRVTAVEQDPVRCAVMRTEHPEWTVCEGDVWGWAAANRTRWDLVISNPPFSNFDRWIELAQCLRSPGGRTLVLGHAGHLGGQKRAPVWREHPPALVAVSTRRAAYRNGETDHRDPVWFVWAGRGESAQGTRLVWLRTERG